MVIQNKTDYIKEGLKQLSDCKFYSLQEESVTQHHNNLIKDAVFEILKTKEISSKTADYLFIENPRNSQILSPCNRPSLCRYCPNINHTGQTMTKTTRQNIATMANSNCQNSNIVYLITCKTCDIQYVGQTKKHLITKFQGH